MNSKSVADVRDIEMRFVENARHVRSPMVFFTLLFLKTPKDSVQILTFVSSEDEAYRRTYSNFHSFLSEKSAQEFSTTETIFSLWIFLFGLFFGIIWLFVVAVDWIRLPLLLFLPKIIQINAKTGRVLLRDTWFRKTSVSGEEIKAIRAILICGNPSIEVELNSGKKRVFDGDILDQREKFQQMSQALREYIKSNKLSLKFSYVDLLPNNPKTQHDSVSP
jgi:hypothetical protein